MTGTTSWPLWLLLGLGTVGFWAIVAYGVGSLFGPDHRKGDTASGRRPLAELDEKLARGQISIDEYELQRRHLTQGH